MTGNEPAAQKKRTAASTQATTNRKHVFLSLGLRDRDTSTPKDKSLIPNVDFPFPLSEWGENLRKRMFVRIGEVLERRGED
ncbi:hypothetical protein KY285_033885 [Solanum tuberosum]|nr:hypothetical protein KY284_033657 [Solanum tuberosum]KAH0648637.1 hypothetical protein KY285_033885 [Solanum tuberosum]